MGPPEGRPPESFVVDQRLVMDLSALGSAPLPLVGGKAVNLGRLTAAGFPVPAAFCLTTAAYRKAFPGRTGRTGRPPGCRPARIPSTTANAGHGQPGQPEGASHSRA